MGDARRFGCVAQIIRTGHEDSHKADFRGDSGIKGALLGYMASGVVKTVAKLGLAAAVAAGAFGLARKASRR